MTGRGPIFRASFWLILERQLAWKQVLIWFEFWVSATCDRVTFKYTMFGKAKAFHIICNFVFVIQPNFLYELGVYFRVFRMDLPARCWTTDTRGFRWRNEFRFHLMLPIS